MVTENANQMTIFDFILRIRKREAEFERRKAMESRPPSDAINKRMNDIEPSRFKVVPTPPRFGERYLIKK